MLSGSFERWSEARSLDFGLETRTAGKGLGSRRAAGNLIALRSAVTRRGVREALHDRASGDDVVDSLDALAGLPVFSRGGARHRVLLQPLNGAKRVQRAHHV